MKTPENTTFDPTAFLEKGRLGNRPESQGESPLVNKTPKLSTQLDSKLNTSLLSSEAQTTTTSLFQKFDAFIDQLVLEQLKNPESLIRLNFSRRENLGRFLSELSRLPEPENPQEALKQFIRIDRTETEHEALKQLFKQIALALVGKAILLKSWSIHGQMAGKGDRAKNPIQPEDLKDLTAAVERGLRPYIHLQTSTSQLIQQNFYSWYKLDASLQSELWGLLEEIQDLPTIKSWLLRKAIQLSAETLGERSRYCEKFYQHLWNSIQKHQFLNLRLHSHMGFSPTLRDGAFLEHSPEKINWIGFEPLTFELMFCEIRFLWKGPRTPQLWVKGSGLEMSMDHQSNMLLTHSGKKNVLQQIDSVSSCEVAFITEESLIRTQSRSLAGQALRKQVESHGVLKRLKQPTTTRGTYQACQALEKLRQGGILFWAREELLTEASGKPALQYILNHAKILLIADFTALQFEDEQLHKGIPKALYVLQKECNLEMRKSHRPLMIKTYGDVRSHSDAEMLFDRVFSLIQNPNQTFPMEPFQIHSRVSPIDQREWEQHWFNPADDQLVDQIEDLKRNATPLGQLAMIHVMHPGVPLIHPNEPSLFQDDFPGINRPNTGFFAWVESSRNGNEIYTASAEQLPEYMKNKHSVFWISPLQESWSAPLQVLLRSQLTRDWFNYSVERKKGAWLVKENDLKSIPIPRHIVTTLETSPNLPQAKAVLQAVPIDPAQALAAIESHSDWEPSILTQVRGAAFVEASRALQHLETHQTTLFSLFSPDDQLIFSRFLRTAIPEKEMTSIGTHPLIRFTPTLTPHMAIQSITETKVPAPGILLTTAKGLTQQLFIQDSWLRLRCLELLKELTQEIAEPTWGELCQMIFVPKNPDYAQAMAQQITKACTTEKMKRKELNHLIGACISSESTSRSKVGLLQ